MLLEPPNTALHQLPRRSVTTHQRTLNGRVALALIEARKARGGDEDD
jgi:hypothetical protein